MLLSVDGYDDPAYLCRGEVGSNDGRLRCNTVSSICLNGRDAVLAHAMQVLDDFLVEVRQACEVGDAFVSKTKKRSI